MKRLSTTVTRKGQVTVPAEIRRALGIREGDKVVFLVDGEEIKFARTGSVVAATAGAVKGKRRPLTAEQMRRRVEEDIARVALERADR